jgi:putative ATP-binding cassette transporter
MKLLSYLYLESRPRFVLAIVAGLASGVAGAGLAKVISDAIQGTVPSGLAIAGFFALCVAYLAGKTGSELALMHLVQRAILRLRVDLSHKILATPHKRLQALGKSELLTIMTNDVTAFVQAFQMIPMALGNFVIVLACSAWLACLSWPLFLMFGGFIALCLVGYHFAERGPLRRMLRLREQLEVLVEHFRGLIDGSRELQLNAARGRHFVEEVIAPDAREFKRSFIGTMTGYTWVSNTGLVLFYVGIGLLLFVVPAHLRVPSGTIASFALILLFLVRPISDMMFSLPLLRQAGVSLGRIQALEGGLEPPVQALPAAHAFAHDGPLLLELRQVAHRHESPFEEHGFTVGPLDLAIGEGELLFVVGGNGSGKTTLAMVLLGLYAPDAGEIVLNGRRVTAENVDAYRQHFCAVFSDFHLFEQLLLADSPALRERAAHYVARLGMAHKVRAEAGRFSTIRLSTGQRKRLALVSAWLEDRPVYLFDEWAADQDPAFKHVFYTELLPELKARGKTVVVVTHDDAYFHCADRLVKLEDGRLHATTPAAARRGPAPLAAVA